MFQLLLPPIYHVRSIHCCANSCCRHLGLGSARRCAAQQSVDTALYAIIENQHHHPLEIWIGGTRLPIEMEKRDVLQAAPNN